MGTVKNISFRYKSHPSTITSTVQMKFHLLVSISAAFNYTFQDNPLCFRCYKIIVEQNKLCGLNLDIHTSSMGPVQITTWPQNFNFSGFCRAYKFTLRSQIQKSSYFDPTS